MGQGLLGLAATTWLLMGLGSATRVMNAGLSCPDWPLCYGEIVPSQQMNLQVFLEWFHRMVAAGVGLATLTLMGFAWLKRRSLPSWLPWGLSFAFGLVLVQGILGGLTVTELLRFDIVTAHLGTGLLFFATLLTLGLLALPGSGSLSPSDSVELEGPKERGSMGYLAWLGLGAVLLVYGQSLLGALVASQWALHQCFASGDLCGVMNSHLLGVAPATIAVLAVAVGTGLMRNRIPKRLKGLGHSALVILLAQVGIGILTYRYRLQVEPLTVAHQMIGAALLGCLVGFTVLAWRMQRSADGERFSPVSQKRVAVTAEITSE
ncbi:COX15/CtaA family protein [Thermostichus vulcanus]|uniref:Heme A synthase n=1 Tax=Thermostichus vulcanus str. 'Rupite' TaxID=2813851 RepID=A0ABT0CD71_THEVL|nr:heme A synthase [Thermostichus vulcanus str. 'Rupite']